MRRKPRGRVVGTFAAALAACAVALAGAAPTVASTRLDPGLFAELGSGIVLVQAQACSGAPIEEGTGFLVGSNVVMTAYHVVASACRVRVQARGSWDVAVSWASWHAADVKNSKAVDVSTIRVKSPIVGHIFTLRTWSAAVGTNLAALGHPLGNALSITQGQVVAKGHLPGGIPAIVVRLLGAEGASGSPLVDAQGNVVSILQRGTGPTTALVAGIDLPSWWRTARTDLCRAYPLGGIPICSGSSPPATTYRIQSCWTQYSAGSWVWVDPTKATTTYSGADISQRGPTNFWAVVTLKDATTSDVPGVTVELLDPNGNLFGEQTSIIWQSGWSQYETSFNWTWHDDASLFFLHPELSGSGTWTFEWKFPDGETCSSSFAVTS